jgi:hypothetical protein
LVTVLLPRNKEDSNLQCDTYTMDRYESLVIHMIEKIVGNGRIEQMSPSLRRSQLTIVLKDIDSAKKLHLMSFQFQKRNFQFRSNAVALEDNQLKRDNETIRLFNLPAGATATQVQHAMEDQLKVEVIAIKFDYKKVDGIVTSIKTTTASAVTKPFAVDSVAKHHIIMDELVVPVADRRMFDLSDKNLKTKLFAAVFSKEPPAEDKKKQSDEEGKSPEEEARKAEVLRKAEEAQRLLEEQRLQREQEQLLQQQQQQQAQQAEHERQAQAAALEDARRKADKEEVSRNNGHNDNNNHHDNDGGYTEYADEDREDYVKTDVATLLKQNGLEINQSDDDEELCQRIETATHKRVLLSVPLPPDSMRGVTSTIPSDAERLAASGNCDGQ